MKHILNNLTEEEKNSIREQHTGGMKVMTENFNKLINSKLGDSKPLVNEQTSINSGDVSCLKNSSYKFVSAQKMDPNGPHIPINSDKPAYYEGKYNNMNAQFYLNGIVRILYEDKEQRGKWKCDNGKLNVYNLGESKRYTFY